MCTFSAPTSQSSWEGSERVLVPFLAPARLIERGRDRASLGDLLRHQPLALQHVQERGVAAEVELIGPLELDAAVAEQTRQHAVDDRRADLRLDVVADDREVLLSEALLPVRLSRD